ncbi:hypothetical protein D6D29_07931 [Aureobasidium pullulans]|nr:hypothetical protein D6D29_07931 [Aureobasidium pullulans]
MMSLTFASDSHGVKGPEFLAINPNGRVPALQDPNTNITSWESMACINYLLRNYDTDDKLVENDDAYKRYEAQAYRYFGVLEVQLVSHEGGWVIAGENHSVVDLHFEPWIRQYGYAGLCLDEYPNLKAWLERVQGLPEVIKAYDMVKAGEEV